MKDYINPTLIALMTSFLKCARDLASLPGNGVKHTISLSVHGQP